jgi:hypothetical protein
MWSKFNFSSNIQPLLRFWYHVESKNPISEKLRHCNSNQTIPTTVSELKAQKGFYKLPLKDEFGIVGFVEYEMDGEGIPRDDGAIHPNQLGGNLLEYLHSEDIKAFGQLVRVLIHPQAILSYPL